AGALKASSVVAGQGAAPKSAQGLAPRAAKKDTPPKAPKAGVGPDHELVILAKFANQEPVGSTQADWAKEYFGNKGSVGDFYDQASDGQFSLEPAHDT